MPSRERLGFIGLGIMGGPMARNLLRAGHPVTVCTRRRAVADALAAETGAVAVETPREVAERSDVVFTMLPDSPQVTEVLAGRDGLLSALAAGALVIDMSTISPVVARELEARARAQGVGMLDAPVSGGDVGAQQGTLSIMVGGRAEELERARPLLAALGTTIVHVGGPGAGQVVKACNQIVVAQIAVAVSEALVLASKAGVDPALMLDALGGGFAANRFMEARRRNLLEHDFTPGFKIDLHYKDLGIVQAAAREYGVVLPGTALVAQLMESLRQHGQGGEDTSALLSALERLSAHRVGERDA